MIKTKNLSPLYRLLRQDKWRNILDKMSNEKYRVEVFGIIIKILK